MTSAARMFSYEVRSKDLVKRFAAAPDVTFKHAQDYMDRVTRSFRKAWLARNKVEFTNPDRIGPIRSKPPVSTQSKQAHKAVYFVRTPRGPRRGRTLNDLDLQIFTVSQALEALEHGARVRRKGGGKLAIPIGVTLDRNGNRIGRWSTPEKFTRANKAGNSRVLVPIQKPGQKATILYWKKPKGRGKAKRYALLPAFMLVDVAEIPPLLNFYGTWDAHRTRRQKFGREMLQRITRDIERGGRRRG